MKKIMKTVISFLLILGVSFESMGETRFTNAYLPIVRVSPNYPDLARESGVEGFCSVIFTVTETGSVENPKILECENRQYFESAVINAISKFKYNPKSIEGGPIVVESMIEFFWFSDPNSLKVSHYKDLGISNIVDNCSATERKCEAHLGNP